MNTVLLGWDPEHATRWAANYDRCVQRCDAEHGLLERWPIGDWHLAPVGTTAHLMLQGNQRGLIGRGTVASTPFLSADPGAPGRAMHHVMIRWTTLLPESERVPLEVLEVRVPDVPWRSSYGATLLVSPSSAAQLAELWVARSTPPAPLTVGQLAHRIWELPGSLRHRTGTPH